MDTSHLTRVADADAMRADRAVRPTQSLQMHPARIVIRNPLEECRQGYALNTAFWP